METTKNPLASKTIWGVFIMLLPTVGAWLGLNITETDAAELGVHIDTVIELVGAVLAIWGRVSATSKVSLGG